ncbi:MAG: 2-amino-4-hydroxy-6-hydroxymethyldihydropteridine diphosphokinase [Chitinispirillales bacterium]|jgi:2-amino-4-hydroxy-6-hydroxymethyldihydropteridine diphosphokinase|nr:2-amino-4-hydroxy-6-hydroxymethyldihydropteridine diphosphokinase [Chitinispirillales bacterium]
MTHVALSIGANLGDREANIFFMERELYQLLADAKSSPLMETEPVGVDGPQPPYLNRIITGYYDGIPHQLLCACFVIELRLGRKREKPKEPRVADVDILLFGDLEINEETILHTLVIPHPEIQNRRFCVEGLARIDPSILVPVGGRRKTAGRLFKNMRADVAAQNISLI